MPPVDTIPRTMTAPAPARRRTTKGRKPPPPQDRLTQRALFMRRVKRSVKPGLWFLGTMSVLVIGAELVRSLPTAKIAPAPVQAVAAPAPAPSSSILARLLADLGLRVSKVEINGVEDTDPALLQQAIGVKQGDPTFGFSLGTVQNRVEQLGPVQTATVERVLPGTIIVSITERDAFAIWQTTSNGQTVFELIDKQGNVIPGQDAVAAKRREPGLLLLTGDGAPAAANTLIAELKAALAVYSHVAAAERVDDLRWNLVLKNQTLVKLPENNEAEAIGQIAALQGSMQLLDRPVEAIDLRQPGRLVVRPYKVQAPPANVPDAKEKGQ